MTLKDFLDFFEFEKVIKWLEEGLEFYVKPVTFFRKFLAKDSIEKFKQFSFYATLVFLLLFIVIENSSLKGLSRKLMIDVATLIFAFIPIFISYYIIKKISKEEINIKDIFWFLIITKILFIPILVGTESLFIHFENYNFLFLHNVLIIYAFLFMNFFSSKILFKKITQIGISILLILIFLNAQFFVISKISIDSYDALSKYNTDDLILQEQDDNASKLRENLSLLPVYRFVLKTDKTNTEMFCFSDVTDTVTRSYKGTAQETRKYIGDLNYNIRVIDSILPKLTFHRNKDYFNECKNYLLLVKKVMQSDNDSLIGKRVEYLRYVDTTSKKVVGTGGIYLLGSTIVNNLMTFSNNNAKYIEKLELCDKPLKILDYVFFAVPNN